MKEYRVSLEVATSLDVTRSKLAGLLGVPRSALAQEQRRRGILWRYEPSTGQTGKIADRIRQLAAEVRPRRSLPGGGGFRSVSLGVKVRYDTLTCTVLLPLYDLVYGRNSLVKTIPKLSGVELTCYPYDEEITPSDQVGQPAYDPDLSEEEARKRYEAWKAAGRPHAARARAPLVMDPSRVRFGGKGSARSGRTDTNEYIVSLDAITSASATRSEVADVLGLPPAAFTKRPMKKEEGAAWRCEVEADRTVGLTERINFLASEVHPRRSFQPDEEIDEIYLDIGVIYDVDKTETCSVRLPMSSLRSLVRKLFVLHVEVTCYPGREAEHDEEEG